ncbi:uncharacterized protein HRG_04376 [Hirsutella rhossiliensis]|uniref:Uncharacterized protein n=1 Tax=Hirsutella rhossiliensis TaxID=111463 RepID=A0A9P8SI91_9HYPO|nr:uncharacterized protein HRG_04376 [Hirsutella rhossiliensis]KAH0963948.1 hypothetical protein HRG_04376 [Hirsutella rhossiliensis]
MADLTAASSAPAASNGTGVTSPRRPTAGPALTGSPSGIRGPRMIMQERAAREARQRAEAEKLAMERDKAEREARPVEEARRRNSQRRSAGVAAGQGVAADAQQPQIDPRHQSRMPPDAPQIPTAAAGKQPPQPQISQLADDQRAHHQTYPPSGAARQPQSHQRPDVGAQPATPAAPQPTDMSKPRNSFPHAFERWETLSAHWEGLTSYWIRKLEQNKDDINRDPLSQQLARQVTDLSAAGANLFHAVVELQRLRASSERKFQRWFFETRAELERAREVNAMMEGALQKERRDRAEAVRDAIDQERGSSKVQKQLAEMRKELSISKEEARRAWEELGRREQEERDRTYSLQTGQPTIVGGVQVVPMTHSGSVSRHGTARDPAGHQQEYGPGHGYQAGQTQASPEQTPPSTAARGGDGYQRRQQHQPEQPGRPRRGSEGGYSEGSDAEADDYETPATTNPPPSGGPESPSTSAGESRWTGAYSDPQDYSGQGYGAPGWETVPRHHHPTRLSDVIEEEDERSRTSASQMSRG